VDLRLGTRRQRAAARVTAALLLLLAVVIPLALASAPPVDEQVYIWLRLHPLAPAPSTVPWWWFLALAVVVTLLIVGRSCPRYVGAVLVAAVAPLVAWLLGLALGRTGPFDATVPEDGTFPAPSAALLGAVVVLAPVAVRVVLARRTRGAVTGRPWLETTVALVMLGLAVLHGWVLVGRGEAWPLDVLGGLALGALVASAAWLWLESVPHGCAACPWSASQHHAPHVVRSRTWLYPAALVWSLAAAGVLLALAATRGIPRLPESMVIGTGLELPLNLAMVGLLVLGVLLARRWHLVGAVLVAFAPVVLGYAASMQYQPGVSVLVLAVTFVPAYLLWLRWHPSAPVRRMLVGAVVASLVLGGVTWAAARTNAYYWGPVHPRSPLLPQTDPLVAWAWAGGVTPTSVRVTARTRADASDVRLVLSRTRDLESADETPARAATGTNDHVVTWKAEGLRSSTRYHYGIEVDDVLSGWRGTFRTFPEDREGFTFVVGADARTGSSGRVFDAIRRHDPLLYLNVGDFFYGDVDTNDPDRYLAQYDANLTAPAQAALYRRVPIAYTWGDHDYAANDADRRAPGRPAALDVYRRVVPHYPLAGGADGPIYQAFTVGGVRFVLTDNRSQRDTDATPPTMLGSDQLRLLRDELRDAGRHDVLVWANADPWVDGPAAGKDTWGGFPEERRRIADMIARYDVDNLLMVSGDAHMLAYDDGSHTDYAEQGDAAFPLLHAAALDRKPGVKGGPYSGPVLPGAGQFGLVRVEPRRTGVSLTIEGVDWRDRVLFRRTVDLP
jgi:hypothetical protein